MNITALNFPTFLSDNINTINRYNQCIFNEKKNIIDYIASIYNRSDIEELYDKITLRKILVDNTHKTIYFVSGFKSNARIGAFLPMQFHALSPNSQAIVFEDSILDKSIIEEEVNRDGLITDCIKRLWEFLFSDKYFDKTYMYAYVNISPKDILFHSSVYAILSKVLDLNVDEFINKKFTNEFNIGNSNTDMLKECIMYLIDGTDKNDPYKFLNYVYNINKF